MSLLSIIACKVLQDEIVWILQQDKVNNIMVIDNEDSKEFTAKLDKVGIQYNTCSLSEFLNSSYDYKNRSDYSVLVYFLEIGLHKYIKSLKEEVYKSIEKMAPISSGILIFYGLCGNVLSNVEKDFEHLSDCNVQILKDSNGRIVDDCIGATVGGTHNYLQLLKSVSDKGTYLFTPMYVNCWKDIFDINNQYCSPEKAIEMMREVHDMVGYKRVAKIQTGLNYTEDFDSKVDEFAKTFNFEIIEFKNGNQDIFKDCYLKFKEDINKSIQTY